MFRREFLKNGMIFGAGSLLLPMFPGMSLALDNAATDNNKSPILVVIFLRGAMDGISMLPPIQDPDYFTNRPSIRILATGDGAALPFREGFGVHPSLPKLHKIASEGSGLFLFGAGSPATTRSHFDAQDWMEAGVTNLTNAQSGFLSRTSNALLGTKPGPTQIIAIQNGLPRSLKGSTTALAFPNFKAIHINGPLTRDKFGAMNSGDQKVNMDPAFYHLYAESKDDLFRAPALAASSGAVVFEKAEEEFHKFESDIPKPALGRSLAHILALIKSQSGVRMAVTEMGGWDTHVNQGNAGGGSFRDRMAELDNSIGFFWEQLGADRERVCLVAMTEFGRTVKENGDRGTDHGHGSTFLVLNPKLNHAGVLHRHKGLRKDLLFEERDLPVAFDYRDIFNEILQKHLRMAKTNEVFPDFHPQGLKLFV